MIFSLTHCTSPTVITLTYFEDTTSCFYTEGRIEGKQTTTTTKTDLDSHAHITCSLRCAITCAYIMQAHFTMILKIKKNQYGFYCL